MNNDFYLFKYDKIVGKSYLKHNTQIEINLNIIKNNKLTILNHICSHKGVPLEKILYEVRPRKYTHIHPVQTQ